MKLGFRLNKVPIKDKFVDNDAFTVELQNDPFNNLERPLWKQDSREREVIAAMGANPGLIPRRYCNLSSKYTFLPLRSALIRGKAKLLLPSRP